MTDNKLTAPKGDGITLRMFVNPKVQTPGSNVKGLPDLNERKLKKDEARTGDK